MLTACTTDERRAEVVLSNRELLILRSQRIGIVGHKIGLDGLAFEYHVTLPCTLRRR